MRALAAMTLATWLLAAGCKADDDYPIVPQPGNGSGKPKPGADAGVDAGSTTSGRIRGTVCVLSDLRQPAACAATGNTGIVVRELGSATQVVTSAGGNFELTVTATDVAILEIGAGSTGLVPSLVPLDVGATSAQAPVPRAAELTAALDGLTGLPPDGTGALALYFQQTNRGPLPGVVVVPPSGTTNAPLYDLAGNTPWVSGGESGPFGASLLVGVPEGTVAAGATGPTGEVLSVNNVRIADGHVTFVTRRVAM